MNLPEENKMMFFIPPPEYVYVFGSNVEGRHGKGAALWAKENRGAVYGRGEGRQGNCYAIPTKKQVSVTDRRLVKRTREEIFGSIVKFVVEAYKTVNEKFYVTRIGCGLAGYKNEDIAPMFKDVIDSLPSKPMNIYFDKEWKPFGLQSIDLTDEEILLRRIFNESS